MTNNLLKKAEALMEAREKITNGYWDIDEGDFSLYVQSDYGPDAPNEDDKRFFAIAANTACDTIQGYQNLVRRMTDAVERLIAGELDMDELGEAKLLLDEARAAILHDATNV